MAGIVDKIRLYNEAYQEAWERAGAAGWRAKIDCAHLDQAIRALIKAGRSSASEIAAEAINHLVSEQKT